MRTKLGQLQKTISVWPDYKVGALLSLPGFLSSIQTIISQWLSLCSSWQSFPIKPFEKHKPSSNKLLMKLNKPKHSISKPMTDYDQQPDSTITHRQTPHQWNTRSWIVVYRVYHLSTLMYGYEAWFIWKNTFCFIIVREITRNLALIFIYVRFCNFAALRTLK
jgi:hypothetical protein